MAGLGRPLEELEVPEPSQVPNHVPASEPSPAEPRR